MGWIKQVLKGVGDLLVSVFRWAFESPVAGVVVGGLGTLYGFIVDDPAIYWPSMAILATGVLGLVVPTVSELIVTEVVTPASTGLVNAFFRLFSPTPVF